MTPKTPNPDSNESQGGERKRRDALSHHDQMYDAQAMCAPCKLCGGKALITDAGSGCGYYVRCENSGAFRAAEGCMITERRLGGWAYNVMDWWNRLHSVPVVTEAEPTRDELNGWLTANCGSGLPYVDATDEPSMLHGLAYVLRQIEGTSKYTVNIGQKVPASSAIRMALDHFAREGIARSLSGEGGRA